MPIKTVLVTGATGYIAKHIVLQLLEAGHSVVASTRRPDREAELRSAMAAHLTDAGAQDRLRVVALDLMQDDGWDAAMDGVDVVMHTASPFPLQQTVNEDSVIRTAVDGALRAVKAAKKAGIRRVIMTSSTVAIMNTTLPAGRTAYDERDWTDLDDPRSNGYVKSKTMAERAVWDWQAAEGAEMQITMINPGFVQGAPLDTTYGTSLELMERVLKGNDPMLPNFGFPVVDVRDVALAHIRAMDTDDSIGKRFIVAQDFMMFPRMAEIFEAMFPDRKITTRIAPNVVIRVLALFDPSIRTILPNLGRVDVTDATAAQTVLGIAFRDAEDAVRDSGRFLVDHGLV